MERQEYTAETYPSFGKKYNGEKAIISLTSWKARINVIAKTLYSLIKQCPGFHIVLVLSEEEFPKMMKELPSDVTLFVDNELIEILWTKNNIKSHKKYFYTMQKYRELPIILADDDLFYLSNFAEKLYTEWRLHKTCIIASRCHYMLKSTNILPYTKWQHETNIRRSKCLFFTTGQGTLFPPNCFKLTDDNLFEIKLCSTADDVYLNALRLRYNIDVINIKNYAYKENAETISSGLYKVNVKQNANDKYIEVFKNDFNTAFVYNIVGNACAASYLTKTMFNHQFINPFTYAILDFESMYNLITKYDTINFSNYKFMLEHDRSCSLIIDNCVKINYVHYKYNANVDKCITETDEGTDFESKNIEQFVIDKYEKRVTLMKRLHIQPVFICASRPGKNFVNDYSSDELLKLLSIDTHYKIIVASAKFINFANTDTKEYIQITDNIANNGLPLANFIFKNSKILQ